MALILCSCNNIYGQYNLDSIYNISNLEQSLDSAKKNRNYKDLADIYYLMGIYEDQINSNNKKAFDHFTWSQTYYKMVKDSAQINNINYKIALKYAEANMYDEAVKQLTIIKDTYLKKNKLTDAIKVLLDMARIHQDHSELDAEAIVLNEAKSINRRVNDESLTFDIKISEISLLIQYGAYPTALDKALSTLPKVSKTNRLETKSKILGIIGIIYHLKNNYNKSIEFIKQSLAIMKSKPYDKLRLEYYQKLSDNYSNKSDYKSAYKFQKKYTDLNDSILNKERITSLNNVAIKYESKEKKYTIKTLKKENTQVLDQVDVQKNWVYSLLAGLVLLMILGYYLIRYYIHRIKTDKIITQQNEKINKQKIRELEDKIELSSMQSLIEGQEKERHRIAQDLHDSLGGLLSTIKLQFNHLISKKKEEKKNQHLKVNNLLDLAVNEVRSISHNLIPEALNKLGLIPATEDLVNRFSSEINPNIDFQHYNIPKNLDKTIELNIYRILQELLNNSIKHSKATEILIQLNKEKDGDILIQFEDDGIGFDLNNLKSSGMGLKNIKSRIAYLKGEVEIDSNPGEGTSILIRVKNKIKQSE